MPRPGVKLGPAFRQTRREAVFFPKEDAFYGE